MISLAVSGQAGSWTELARGCHMAARRRPVPWNLHPQGLDLGTTCSCAAASCPICSGPLIFCGTRVVAISDVYVARDEECGCQHIMGEVRNRSASARPPLLNQGIIRGRRLPLARFFPSLSCSLDPNPLGSRPSPYQIRVLIFLCRHSIHPDPDQDGSEGATVEGFNPLFSANQ
jgi:hypothetical protein